MFMERSVLETRLERLERFLESIYKVLLCPICLDVVRSPARQCVEGHPLCEQCLIQLSITSCPTCTRPISSYRNVAIEQVSDEMIYKCSNVEHGCGVLGSSHEIEAHALECPYRQYVCPCIPCDWTGFKPELQVHMTSTHPRSVITSSDQMLQIPLEWNKNSLWVLFLWEEIFLVNFNMNQDEDALIGSISCVDNSVAADRFKYRTYLKLQHNEIILTGFIRRNSDIVDLTPGIQSVIYIPSAILKKYPQVGASWPPDESIHIEVRVSVEDTVNLPVYQGRKLILGEREGAASMQEGVFFNIGDDEYAKGAVSVTKASETTEEWENESEETNEPNNMTEADNEVEEENDCFYDAEQFVELGQDLRDKVLIMRVKEKVKWLLKCFSCNSELKKKIDVSMSRIHNILKNVVEDFNSYIENDECDATTMYIIAEKRRILASIMTARFEIAQRQLSTTEEGRFLLKNQSWTGGAALESGLILLMAELEGRARWKEWHNLKVLLSNSEQDEINSRLEERKNLLYDEGVMRLLTRVEQKLGPEAIKQAIHHLGNKNFLLTNKQINDLVNDASFIRWSQVDPAAQNLS